jgi:hypothetical protein
MVIAENVCSSSDQSKYSESAAARQFHEANLNDFSAGSVVSTSARFHNN